MKSLLLFAAVAIVVLSACRKESLPPAQPPKPVTQVAPASVAVAVAGEMSKEEKEKAIEVAKAASKSAGRSG